VLCVLVAFVLAMLHAGVPIVPLVLAMEAALSVVHLMTVRVGVRFFLGSTRMLRVPVVHVGVTTVGDAFLAVSALVRLTIVRGLVPLVPPFLSVPGSRGRAPFLAVIHVTVRAVSLALAMVDVRAVVFVMVLSAAVVRALVVRAVAGVVHSAVTISPGSLARHQIHAADGAGTRLAPDDLRVHGADVLGLGAYRVHVEVGRHRGEGAVREEPPQIGHAGGDVLLPRGDRRVRCGERRDVSRPDREDGPGPGHLGISDRRGLFEPRWQLADEQEHARMTRGAGGPQPGRREVHAQGADGLGTGDDKGHEFARLRPGHEATEEGGPRLSGAGVHCRLSAP
jgi:hypothetical protein